MQEISLYAKFRTVISHLYQSITSEDDLRTAIIKRRMDFIRKEIIILGDELTKLEKELVVENLNKELDEFEEFKG